MEKPDQKLPMKFQAMSKSIMKSYETKQYKKGLKTCDKILSSHPNHGETMALKGLLMNSTGKKEEAYSLIKEGIRNNIFSPVCWHVYGLVYRSDNNYVEAVKCYKNALRYENTNSLILKDLSFLQLQLQDFKGAEETRRQMLLNQPKQNANWIGFINSCHLANDLETALTGIDKFLETQEFDKPSKRQDEILLQKLEILMEMGSFVEGLKFIEENLKNFNDAVKVTELQAICLAKLGRFNDCVDKALGLIHINTETNAFHIILQSCLMGNTDLLDIPRHSLPIREVIGEIPNRGLVLRVYRKLLEKFSRSHVIKGILLELEEEEEFVKLLTTIVQGALKKASLSLIQQLKVLYKNERYAHKISVIGAILNESVTTLKESLVLPGNDEKLAPTTMLAALFNFSEHSLRTKDLVKARALIDEALEHTPTQVESYILSARICKHEERIAEGVTLLKTASDMDKTDRFTSLKLAKYQARANQVDEAIATYAIFSDPINKNTLGHLRDLQVQWMCLELAAGFERKGNVRMAMKQYHNVCSFYTQFWEDIFDFHQYCFIRSYTREHVATIRDLVTVFGRPQYMKAAIGLSRCYIRLFENNAGKAANAEPDYSKMTAKERKKAKQAAKRKAAKKKNKQTEVKSAAEKTDEKDTSPIKDKDPFGEELLKKEKPLDEAWELLKPICSEYVTPQDNELAAEVHYLSTSINTERKQYLLALRSAFAAYKCSPKSHFTLAAIHKIQNSMNSEGIPEDIFAVAQESIAKLPIVSNEEMMEIEKRL
eukprot:TRINITY_DN8079_c0_g1_i1.p1 TRINITY_DN8079_c0_g1~~TRINITY_DN8079_c0_g1_i1.p1  ORF type:complete len:772 (+),score=223.26 TRINITY_DN8079_c0_g1_i1:57-2372(+)